VLGGVSLEGEAKERYNAIQQELAQLSTKFSNNVLDATKVGYCEKGSPAGQGAGRGRARARLSG
jgi:Zn-dependent oligopeptidase